MKYPIAKLTILIVISVLVIGCSNHSDPVQVPPGDTNIAGTITDSIPSPDSNRYFWGIWDIFIPADRQSVDVTPLRAAGMHLNIVGFLETSPCTDCLRITNPVFYPDNRLSVDLTLTHPFHNLPEYTGFDVRGILATDSDFEFPLSGRKIAWGDGLPRLLLPNGYTSVFNPTEFDPNSPGPAVLKYINGKWATVESPDATLNAYSAFQRGTPRRMFASGDFETKTVWLHVPYGPVQFGYIVDACWAPVDEVIDPLVDFPPEANCLEAYRVDVLVGSDLGPYQFSSTSIEIEVYDHQGSGTIESVTVEAPDLFDGTVELDYVEDTGINCFLYEGDIVNVHGAGPGEYPLLVRVVDVYMDPNIGGIDAWFVYPVNIENPKGWVRTWSDETIGGGWDTGYAVAVDSAGNIYVGGHFTGTCDFDPGPGVVEKIAFDNDAYICRYDPVGNFIWVRTWGGEHRDQVVEIRTDPFDNIFVLSDIAHDTDLDPGPGVDIVESDLALSKFTTDGDYVWGRGWSISCTQNPICLSVDGFGNSTLGGHFTNPIDLVPGPGIDEREPTGERDIYLISVDSNGEYKWGHTWGGPGGVWSDHDKFYTHTSSPSGLIFVAFTISKEADFDPGPGEDIHPGGQYLSRFNVDGEYLGVLYSPLTYFDMTSDIYGNIYAMGRLNHQTNDLDPGPGVDEHEGPNRFLYKYNVVTGYQWGFSWGWDLIYLEDLYAAPSGEVYLTGYIDWNLVDFAPGPDTDYHGTSGSDDGFLSKYLSTGEYVWTRTWGGELSTDKAYGVCSDFLGNAFITGSFDMIADFNPGPGIEYRETSGNRDAYLLKLPPDGNW